MLRLCILLIILGLSGLHAQAQSRFLVQAEAGLNFTELGGVDVPFVAYERDTGFQASIMGGLFSTASIRLMAGIRYHEMNYTGNFSNTFFEDENELPETVPISYSLKAISIPVHLYSGLFYAGNTTLMLNTGLSPFFVLDNTSKPYTYSTGQVEADLSEFYDNSTLFGDLGLRFLIDLPQDQRVIAGGSLGYDLFGIYQSDFEKGRLISLQFNLGYQLSF